ncbi:MAG TPA: response regulator [Burkholderiaceae bacterium]|nr:response regulator [Burkholderiaceae bacterium]
MMTTVSSSPAPPTVFIVDDDAAVLNAFSRLLRVSGYAVRTFASAQSLLDHGTTDLPGCLVLDVAMPGLNGLELQQALIATHGDRPTIFVSGASDVPTSVQAMKLGAVDFLTKPVDDEVLLSAIRVAIDKDQQLRAARTELKVFLDRFATLTQREREVLHEVVAGRLNKQIAGDLGIVEKTIKVHRHRVMGKMQASSLAELVRMTERAQAGGWVATKASLAC